MYVCSSRSNNTRISFVFTPQHGLLRGKNNLFFFERECKTTLPEVKTITHDLRASACYELILSLVLSLVLLNFTQVAPRHIKVLFPRLTPLSSPSNNCTAGPLKQTLGGGGGCNVPHFRESCSIHLQHWQDGTFPF